MDTARYFFAVLVVTFLPPAMIWWFLVHPFVSFWRKLGPRATITTLAIAGMSGIVGLISIRGTLVGTDLGTHVLPLGAAALLVGVAIGIAVQRKKHLTSRILSGVPELEPVGTPQVMLDQGIYARIRHPRYVEVALGTLGYAAFANHSGSWLVALATVPVLHLIVLVEERELVERFGQQYRDYMARTPRYWPRRAGKAV